MTNNFIFEEMYLIYILIFILAYVPSVYMDRVGFNSDVLD